MPATQMPQTSVQTLQPASAQGIPAPLPTAAPAPVPAIQIGIPRQIIPRQPHTPAPVSVPAQQSAVPMQSPVPIQQPAAAPAPIPAAPAQQIPTTAAPEQYSFDKLAVALSNVCALPDGQPKVHALLQQFGVNALFDLPKDRYGDFATALRGIGGVI